MSGFQKVTFLPVANHAKKGPPNRKIAKKLARRINDFEAMRSAKSHESKVESRIMSGGFHRPGSMQK